MSQTDPNISFNCDILRHDVKLIGDLLQDREVTKKSCFFFSSHLLKGVFAKNERGYRLTAKKYRW